MADDPASRRCMDGLLGRNALARVALSPEQKWACDMGSASRPIEEVFLDSAKGFLWAADHDQVVSCEAALQSMCVAIELALKAYLIGYVWTDDQSRRLIRHNLPRSVQHAHRLGLVTPKRCKMLASFAGPYYQVHALGDFVRQHPRIIKVAETMAEILGLIQWIRMDIGLRSVEMGASKNYGLHS